MLLHAIWKQVLFKINWLVRLIFWAIFVQWNKQARTANSHKVLNIYNKHTHAIKKFKIPVLMLSELLATQQIKSADTIQFSSQGLKIHEWISLISIGDKFSVQFMYLHWLVMYLLYF